MFEINNLNLFLRNLIVNDIGQLKAFKIISFDYFINFV